MAWLAALKARARALKSEVVALVLAARHPRTPWYAKALVVAIVAYALSPIDLIPDFIPVLGLVDDIILLPFAIVLAVKMIPPAIMAEHRATAAAANALPRSRLAAVAIVVLWLLGAALLAWLLWPYIGNLYSRAKAAPISALP